MRRRLYADTRHYNMPFKNYAVQGFGATPGAPTIDPALIGLPTEDLALIGLSTDGAPLPVDGDLLGELENAAGAAGVPLPSSSPLPTIPQGSTQPDTGPAGINPDLGVATKGDLATSVAAQKKSILWHAAAVVGIAIIADYFFLRPKARYAANASVRRHF